MDNTQTNLILRALFGIIAIGCFAVIILQPLWDNTPAAWNACIAFLLCCGCCSYINKIEKDN